MKQDLTGRTAIRTMAALVLFCLTAVLLAACGGGSSSSSTAETTTTEAEETTSGGKEETGTLDGEGKKIAFLSFGFGNSFSDAAVKGAREKAAELNVSLEAFDGKFDPGNQASQCQDAITSGRFAAIVVGAIAGPTMVPCAEQAKAAGIPVVAWADAIGTSTTSAVPTVAGVVANVYTPITTLYSEVGPAIEAACKGFEPCGVVNLNTLELQPEVAPIFAEQLEKAAETPGIEVVEQPEAGLEVSTGQAAMQDILAKGTEFNVLTSPGAQTTEGALIALKSAGKKVSATGEGIRVLASGATVQQLKAIHSGELWGAITTLPVTEGETAVEVALKAALGMSFPKSTIASEVLGLPLIISSENEAEWHGFTGQYAG